MSVNSSKLDFKYASGIETAIVGKTIILSVDIDAVGMTRGRVGYEFNVTYTDGSTQYFGAWVATFIENSNHKKITGDFKGRVYFKHTVKNIPISTFRKGGIYLYNDNGVCSVGRPQLEIADIGSDWSPAPEDTQDQLMTKADQTLTQEQLNALNEQNARLTAELQAKASINEVKQVILDYEALVTARASDRQFYESALKLSAERLTAMSLDIGALKQKTTFIDSYITQSNEGLVIGRTDGSTSMLFSPNGRISMFSAGAEVMYIDKGVIHIDNGVFTKTLQIGRFVTMQHPQNPDINATYYVGERSR